VLKDRVSSLIQNKMDLKNKDKGVAGLTILLSLVTMLFVIGLLVMIFSLMGGEMQDATYDTGTVTVTNESKAWVNETGYTLSQPSSYLNPTGYTITAIYNITDASDHVSVGVGNATVSSSYVVTNASATTYDNVSISYTFNYDASNDATNVMGNTSEGIAGVSDWFDIFIVIGAMVVLILLTVIIITAIRGSGLMSGGSA